MVNMSCILKSVVGVFLMLIHSSLQSSILVGPGSVSAFERSFVRLYCLASIDIGRQGKIVWVKDSELIADGNEVVDGITSENYVVWSRFENQQVESELNITKVERYHDGEYVCQVRVYVSNPDFIVESPSAECTLRVFYLPEPTCRGNSSFLLNEDVSLRCFSDPGEKTADLKWLLNGFAIISKTFSVTDTIHILDYKFSATAENQGRIYECTTSSESFQNQEKACAIGPLQISLSMSIESISSVGGQNSVECNSNGKGEIQYSFYQNNTLVKNMTNTNILEVNPSENDLRITCHAIDSNSIAGSVDIFLPGKPIQDRAISTLSPTTLPSTLTPVPLTSTEDNVVAIAVGATCAFIVVIVCAVGLSYMFLRKRKQLKKEPHPNDDLFLEEAFGRKKSLNVSFRKIQKRQSKIDNETRIAEVDEDNEVKFISERNIESTIDLNNMPDVVTSIDQNNLAYNQENDDEPVNENNTSPDSDSEYSYTYIDPTESERNDLELHKNEKLEVKNGGKKEIDGRKVGTDNQVTSVSSRLDALISDENVEDDGIQSSFDSEPQKHTIQSKPELNTKINGSNDTHSEEHIPVNHTTAGAGASVSTTEPNTHYKATKQYIGNAHTITKETNGSDVDEVDMDNPPRHILPFLGNRAQISEQRNTNQSYTQKIKAVPAQVSQPIAKISQKPLTKTNTNKMATNGVFNLAHKKMQPRTPQQDVHQRREQSNVVRNPETDSRRHNPPHVVRNINHDRPARNDKKYTEHLNQRPPVSYSNKQRPTRGPRDRHDYVAPRMDRLPETEPLNQRVPVSHSDKQRPTRGPTGRHDYPASRVDRLPETSIGSSSSLRVFRNSGAKKSY